MSTTKPKNFRMSQNAVKLLREVASANGVTETEVVEQCLARYATELGIDAKRAMAVLLEHVAKTIAAGKGKPK